MEIDKIIQKDYNKVGLQYNQQTEVKETKHPGTYKIKALTIERPSMDGMVYKKPEGLEKPGKDRKVIASNVTNKKNQMVVLSNTISEEDLKGMLEEGCSLKHMTRNKIVTVTDRIKIKLAKAGVALDKYASSMDKAMIEEVTGSKVLASKIEKKLQEANLPITRDSVEQLSEAVEMSKSIGEITNGMKKYLTEQGMGTTLEDIYISQYSAPTVDEEGVSQLPEEIQDQVKSLLEGSGLPTTPENMQQSMWMISQKMDFTVDNLKKFTEYEQIQLPIKEEDVIENGVYCILDGKHPREQDLLGAIQLKKSHEEIRLHMMVKANQSLVMKEQELDLAPIEEAIEKLNILEQELSEQTKVVEGKIQEIKEKPVEILYLAKTIPSITLEDFHKAEIKVDVMKSYEALETKVRPDLGDSLQKAFQGIDGMLKDMELEVTAENTRAVKALSYGNMEITPENIEMIKEKDALVQKVFENLKPQVVTDMLKSQINPLEIPLEELADLSQELMGVHLHEEEEKFSHYLWKLEKNHELTQEERDGYIGIYRLIRQVEKNGEASLGELIRQGGDLNLKNLMTQILNKNKGSMNYQVDDNFGGLNQVEKGNTKGILRQVEEAFAGSENEVLNTEYARLQQQEFYERVNGSKDIYRILEEYDVPVTAIHIEAMEEILSQNNIEVEKFFQKSKVEKLKEKVLEDFSKALKSPKELAKAQEELQELATRVMKSMITEEKVVTARDIREMQTSIARFEIATTMSKEQVYQVPVMIQNQVTNVTLRVKKNPEQKGNVMIHFQVKDKGDVFANVTVEENKLKGYIASSNQQVKENLEANAEILKHAMEDIGYGDLEQIYYVKEEPASYQKKIYDKNENDEKVSTKELFLVAEHILNYLKESV